MGYIVSIHPSLGWAKISSPNPHGTIHLNKDGTKYNKLARSKYKIKAEILLKFFHLLFIFIYLILSNLLSISNPKADVIETNKTRIFSFLFSVFHYFCKIKLILNYWMKFLIGEKSAQNNYNLLIIILFSPFYI